MCRKYATRVKSQGTVPGNVSEDFRQTRRGKALLVSEIKNAIRMQFKIDKMLKYFNKGSNLDWFALRCYKLPVMQESVPISSEQRLLPFVMIQGQLNS